MAPAGSWESLVAAVQNGADAVYLGGKSFSARQSADNFDLDELARAVSYAHIRGVKVYLTANTLVRDDELREAMEFLRQVRNAGVDGIIVQDLGLAGLVARLMPDLPLHASTQMTVHNLPAAELLGRIGFCRIVLARELSLEQIAWIKNEGRIEVEAFVHGALCVGYSGQCLMSSMIGGRSGNRGRCAQPCRLNYELLGDGQVLGSGYLLSTRDLNLSGHFPDLIDAGISAFKIEGRLRRAEYVATVTGIYRRLLDRTLSGHFHVTEREQKDLAQVFNRRFSRGYFFGRLSRELMNFTQPNNRGTPAGRVQRYDARTGRAIVLLESDLAVGDGLDFWVSVGGRVSTEVHRITVDGNEVEHASSGTLVTIPAKGKIRPGDRVFKTWDAELLRKARETYSSARETKKIPLRATLSGGIGRPLTLTLDDDIGHRAEALGDIAGQAARQRPLDVETASEQLNRLGNTPFEIVGLEYRVDEGVMYPLGALNEVRRRAVEDLERLRLAEGEKRPISEERFTSDLEAVLNRPTGAVTRFGPLLTVAVSDLDALAAAVDAGADVIYFPGEGFNNARRRPGPRDIARAVELTGRSNTALVLWIPRIVHDKELEFWDGLIQAGGEALNGIITGNLGVIHRHIGGTLPVWADYHTNVFNRETIRSLADLGVAGVTLSPELNLGQVRALAGRATLPVEALVQGSVPLMVSEYCIVGAVAGEGRPEQCGACKSKSFMLKDRLGVLFPVTVDSWCRMHIFNSRDLSAADIVPELLRAGVAAVRIDGRLKSPAYVGATTEIYRGIVDAWVKNPDTYAVPERLKKTLDEFSPQGTTRGHYFRGVL